MMGNLILDLLRTTKNPIWIGPYQLLLSGDVTLGNWFDQAVKQASTPTFDRIKLTNSAAASKILVSDADGLFSPALVAAQRLVGRVTGGQTSGLTAANAWTILAESLTGILKSSSGVVSTLDFVDWTTPAFSAGDYTAAGAMTWAVEAGDVATFAYTLIGKTMFVIFSLANTVIGGTPSSMAYIKIPAGKVASKQTLGFSMQGDSGGYYIAACSVNPSQTVINVYKSALGNFTAGANHMFGNIFFEIN